MIRLFFLPLVLVYLRLWVRGLNQQFAKLPSGMFPSVGSNPTGRAIKLNVVDANIGGVVIRGNRRYPRECARAAPMAVGSLQHPYKVRDDNLPAVK